MDGSEVIIAVFGNKGVGKTSFIETSLCQFEIKRESIDSVYFTGNVDICGRNVAVKIVENPELCMRAALVVALFDLTNHETFVELPQLLELAHRVCPTAYLVIIGTKADLRKDHHVLTTEAESFCREYQGGKIPYYEICKDPPEGIQALFKEILARPLINDHVLKMSTEKENMVFIHDTMDWAIRNGSANILTHLRDLGYCIPDDLIRKYDDTIAAYLLGEYPIMALPKYTIVKKPEFISEAESELDEDDEPMNIIDHRSSLVVSKSFLLQFSDISLSVLPLSFFRDLLPLSRLTHVDLSCNILSEVPLELFQLTHMTFLNLSHNNLSFLPPYTHWGGQTCLEILNISHNALGSSEGLSPVISQKKLGGVGGGAFFSRLWFLDVSCNKLTCCPQWLLLCKSLKHLDLSGNKIHTLPSELGSVTHLHSLLLKDLPLRDPPPPIPSLGTHTILTYLQFKHKSTQSLNSMRVIVVGPEKVGKSTLISRLKGESSSVEINPTKGLEVTEWKYKGDVLRRNAVTFDLWDFSGCPRYKFIYSCFDCTSSLHIVVFDINTGYSEIIRWLCDIQSFSTERVPVLLVFTHMDQYPTKEKREEEKKSRIEWLHYNLTISEKPDSSPAFTLLTSTMSQTVKSLQDLDRNSVYERIQTAIDHQDFASNLVPLMPLVLTDPHFTSSITNEGISHLRKVLYRIGAGSFRTTHPSLLTIGMEVPTVYVQVEDLIRQLRGHMQSVKTEGERKPFYLFTDIKERLRRPLKQLQVTAADFLAILRFLHQRGIVYLFDSTEYDKNSTPVVAINPQIIGYLLQRTIRSGEMHSEGTLLSGFLPNVHPAMIWGVDPVMFSDEATITGMTGSQLIDFLNSIDLCAPLVPGACLIPSILPPVPVPGTTLVLDDMVPRRVYILGYLPSFFWSHLTSRILNTLVRNEILQKVTNLESSLQATPTSPTSLPPRPTNPLVTPTGAKLYLWQKHFVFEDVDGSKLWVAVFEGGQLGPESTQYCGRIDVLVNASREKEALLLRLVTEEIDQLISGKYPSLLDSGLTPQLVDILVPLTFSWFANPKSPTGSYIGGFGGEPPLSFEDQDIDASPLSIGGGRMASKPRAISVTSLVDTVSLHSFNSIQGTLHEAFASIKATGTLPISINSEERVESGAEPTSQEPTEDYTHYLVPAWECLQESFKSPSQQLRHGLLDFQGLLPDLLCADYPAHYLISPPESHMSGVKVQEAKGMFLRQYYSEKSLEPPKRHMGAQRMYSLKNHITQLREDFNLLNSLSCPYIMSPIGIHYSWPVLAMELSPHGSVRKYLDSGKDFSQSGVHQIALQVLSAINFLNINGLNYHHITCDNVFLWLLEPVAVKLSDAGLIHDTKNCDLCATLSATQTLSMRKSKMYRFNLIMFALFLYELVLHHRLYENILSPSCVVLAVYHQQLEINIEAEFIHKQSFVKDVKMKACHSLCLTSILQLCMGMNDVTIATLESRLSLCAGDNKWAPLKLTLDIECLFADPNTSLIYWASGSRGLVIGSVDPSTGKIYSRILAEAPTPESGLFANRRGKPIPIAVGHATAIDLCPSTGQVWVGTENGLMGSVYVFNLPDFKSHHYIHLQDAVLSLKILNQTTPTTKAPPTSTEAPPTSTTENEYLSLVGLANGTIIIFKGSHQGRVLENPLQGPKKVITTFNRKPCLSINVSSDGFIWTACGENFEVFELSTMKSVRRHVCKLLSDQGNSQTVSNKSDVIIHASVSKVGVWSVTRRSSVLRLWDMISGQLKASFNVRNILKGEYTEITALVISGHAVWVGTRSGYLLLLDATAIERQEQEKALKGFQYCGEGRVKEIVPYSHTLKVLCSLEYPDEVSGAIMTWEYQSSSLWQPHKIPVSLSRCFTPPENN